MSYHHDVAASRLTRALGWASLGLGVAEVSAPRTVSQLSGFDDSGQARAVVPLVGARQLLHGVGLLRGHRAAGWVWTRVAGDAIDLALLSRALRDRAGPRRRRTAAATAAVLGITAVDLYAASKATRARRTARASRSTSDDHTLRVHAAVTVNRGVAEVYRFWRDFENLPRFMAHLESVRITGEKRSHWVAKAPAGRSVEWDAEILVEEPNALISWRSLGGTHVSNSGSVRFLPAPGGRGTEVAVELEYSPPGGRVAVALARLYGEHPDQQVHDDLRRFKQVIEVGEVVRSDGSPEGTNAHQRLRQRPAQPAPAMR